MIISSILIGLSWYLVTMGNTYRDRVAYKSEKTNMIKRIEFLLTRDLSRAGRYELGASQLDLWFENDSLSYVVDELSFYRIHHNKVDTIALGVEVILFEDAQEDILASISFDQQWYDYTFKWSSSSKQKVSLRKNESEGTLIESENEQ